MRTTSILAVIGVAIYHTTYARLNNQLGTLDAGRCGDVECCSVAVVGTFCHLGDGVGLGVQNIGLGFAHIILADVLKTRGGSVVAVRDYHLVLDDERTHLTTYAVGVLGPDARHTQVAAVKLSLFFFLVSHSSLVFCKWILL